MITADPARRAALLADIQQHLAQDTSPEDRGRLEAFAAIVFQEMPDSVALHLEPDAVAARIKGYFRYVAGSIPPEHQLYRGLPGIHVTVRNPDEAEEAATGSASGHYHEVTIVETHTPDAPFIFESLKNFFQREGLRVFSAIHPIFTVRRQWERVTWIGGPGEDGSRELFCQFRIERVEAREKLRRLEHQIYSLLKSVFLAVESYTEMRRLTGELAGRLRARRGDGDMEASRSFLTWMLDDNYVHLGLLRFRRGADGKLHPDQDAALGAFRDPALVPTVFPGLNERIAAHIEPGPDDDRIIDLDYCTNAFAIHHLEPIDDIVVREWAPDGGLAGATLMLGRLAKSAFATRAQDIPLLRPKLEQLLATSGALVNSHAYRETRAVFNHFPKRELLYSDVASLKAIIDRMVYMAGDEEIAVTTRQGRGYSAALVAFSDTRYSRKGEEDLKTELAGVFGPISFSTWADCGTTGVLVYYFDAATLERPLDAEVVREMTQSTITTWEDQAAIAIEQAFGPIEGRRLFKKYVRTESRSGIYRESTKPSEVPADLVRLEHLEGRLELSIIPATAETATLKLYSPTPLSLTETLRTLQNLKLGVTEELSIPLALPGGRKGYLSRLTVEATPRIIGAMIQGEARLLDALRALHEQRATDCPLNGLILLEGLAWRQVEVLRNVRNHLLQVRPHYNADTINGVLLRNSTVAKALFDLFDARFDPTLSGPRDQVVARADEVLRAAYRTVASLIDDEILRGMENLLRAAVRTNFFQHPERPVISMKIESAKVEGMVSPRPLFEIYVHSRHLQGIHLRMGKVARGGIRWSDRHDDFRTEILGLVKAQQVKNVVIVPVGSKGGFVLKGTVPPRPALDSYLVDRYRQFISGLLDVTDNLVDGKVVNPPEVVRHDGDDPYLVVAADKGTAHLSDTANSVSSQYGFWLGDAFASGGSVGYDHKREGITARGAWECIKHNFRLLGHDIQTTPFTMAGIGDMSGDVFGNGVLLSPVTKLVAAFDHRHIFLDPNPDPAVSLAERRRMFALPRSSWMDYAPSLISQGGGVFDRNAKSIPLSAEVQALLDLQKDEASGEEVIRAILAARVDLLYNGGIGTYIKASSEEHADAGDRANDRVRVDAADVRARVVGEGGNLGLTQRGRIELWTRGTLVNTDAVDNSAGVDMSDHEVNIKILLDLLVRSGVIKDRATRNAIIAEMTDNVSELVLADNINQSRALTLDGRRSAASYEAWVDLVESHVRDAVVNRADAALPRRSEFLASKAKDRGLPRPVLCVLLGHVKNWVYAEVLESDVPDSDVARPFLDAYFPAKLRTEYKEHFGSHPLKREIIATCVINYLINNAGVSFLTRVMAATKADMGRVVATYLEVDRASGAAAVREALYAQHRPVDEEIEALLAIEDAIEGTVRALLEGRDTNPALALQAAKEKYGL
jgi:glutamate dehydrogenase